MEPVTVYNQHRPSVEQLTPPRPEPAVFPLIHRDSERSVASLANGELNEAASEGPSREPSVPRAAARRRGVQTCSECRRRKIKCDRKFPCGPCTIRDEEHMCRAVTGKPKPSSSSAASTAVAAAAAGAAAVAGASAPRRIETNFDHAALSRRVDALQLAALKSGAVQSHDVDLFSELLGGSSSNSPTDTTLGNDDFEFSFKDPEETLQVDETEEVSQRLEHIAFGWREQNPRPADVSAQCPLQLVLQRSIDSVATAENETIPGQTRGKVCELLLALLNPLEVIDIFAKPSDLLYKTLARLLPSGHVGQKLVQCYLDKVLWMHRCFHVPTFLMHCDPIWALPAEAMIGQSSLGFLGLYFMVCSLGLMFMDDEEAAALVGANERHKLIDTWYNIAETANRTSVSFGIPKLENVACSILMMEYMGAQSRTTDVWTHLGSTIKLAQNLGLDNLGDETLSPAYEGSSVITREVGRRIWWVLVTLEWTVAARYGLSSCVQPENIKTALPLNINDEDLAGGNLPIPNPPKTYTDMSYTLARIRLAKFENRRARLFSSHQEPPYRLVLLAHRELHQAMETLPPLLERRTAESPMETEPVKAMINRLEKTALQVALQDKIVRLHRPFFVRGYSNDKYLTSKENCVDAAREVLRLVSTEGQSSEINQSWLALGNTFISSIVVLKSLLVEYKSQIRPDDIESRRTEVKKTMASIKDMSRFSSPASNMLPTLESLLGEAEKRRNMFSKPSPPPNPIVPSREETLEQFIQQQFNQSISAPSTLPLYIGSTDKLDLLASNPAMLSFPTCASGAPTPYHPTVTLPSSSTDQQMPLLLRADSGTSSSTTLSDNELPDPSSDSDQTPTQSQVSATPMHHPIPMSTVPESFPFDFQFDALNLASTELSTIGELLGGGEGGSHFHTEWTNLLTNGKSVFS